jgi:hypothetical protein
MHFLWSSTERARECVQEADALGLSEHRGNSSRIVANVAVVSELERLESRARRDADALKELVNKTAALESAVDEHTREQRRAESALTTRRRRMDGTIAHGQTTGKVFARIALDHQQALVRNEAATKLATKSRAALEKHRARCAAIEKRAHEIATQQTKPRTTTHDPSARHDAGHDPHRDQAHGATGDLVRASRASTVTANDATDIHPACPLHPRPEADRS